MLNASPKQAAAPSRGGSRPSRTARRPRAAPPTIRNTSSVSGLLSRLMATVIGVSASTSAATAAAPWPHTRLTETCRIQIVASAATISGSIICQVPYPRRRHDRPMTIRAKGGLSTVRKFPASSEPKNHAFQLSVPLSTAAL